MQYDFEPQDSPASLSWIQNETWVLLKLQLDQQSGLYVPTLFGQLEEQRSKVIYM